jgi:hypothetical protein
MCVKLAVAGWRDVPLFRNCALRLASLHPKAGVRFSRGSRCGRKLQKMRVVSVRSGSDSAFLCESGSVSGVRNAYFRKCGHRRRSVARSFGSPIEISREWEGHHGSSITRISGRTTTRIFGSGSCRRGTQLVWAGSWRLPDDFCAPTTSGSSRSRQRRASKRRLNCRWSFRAASAACSRRMPPCPPLAAARLITRSWQHR